MSYTLTITSDVLVPYTDPLIIETLTSRIAVLKSKII